jgi:PAS domain S-box-containing protein
VAADFFELSLDNLCIVGFDGNFTRVNPSWTRTLGWTAAELMARPSIEFVHPDDRAATLAARGRLHVGTPMGPLVNRYVCRDGSYRWLEWRSIAADGLVYAAARDITEQRRAEDQVRALQRQLIFADRMASIGTLGAGAAHELNNPLTYVTTNLGLIVEGLRTLGDAPSIAELLDMAADAQAGAERIRTIVRGLETFSRVDEEHRTVLHVRPVVELALTLTAHEIHRHAHLLTDYGPMPQVEADDARLAHVFINLLINAAQALEGRGGVNEVRIVTSTDAAGQAVIEIRDTGSGIPASMLDRVFDAFFTTKPIGIGTGLGLYISHNIVSALGGSIEVVSEEGVGTTFRVVLPPAAGSGACS